MAKKLKDKYEFNASVQLPKITAKDIEVKAERRQAIRSMQQGILAASARIDQELEPFLDSAMLANVWNWPRDTNRQNGSTAGVIRDIYDTGTLSNSLTIQTQFLQTKVNTTIKYSAPYANVVYYGGIVQPYGNPYANAVVIPGRPWVEAALKGKMGLPVYDIGKVYQVEVDKAWRR